MKFTAFLLGALSLVLVGTAHSQSKLDRMITPVANPVNFEDPRPNTELRALYLYHELGEGFATGGGDIRVYALQARWALNDHFALIATKDGYINANYDNGLADDEGMANVALGFKHAFHRDDAAGSIGTWGVTYEIPLGDEEVFQGEGDGIVYPFFSGGAAMQDLNVMVHTGFRLPLDDEDSTLYDLDLHFDVPLNRFYPTLDFNLVHVVDAGDRIALTDEGADLINFGASEADGKTLVTGAVGMKYRLSDQLDFGAAYQVPLTDGRGSDLFDWRISTDLVYSVK